MLCVKRPCRAPALLLLLGLLLLGPRAVQAQSVLLTYDNANFVQNLITAVQAVFIVANQLLELAGVEELALDDDYDEMLTQLGEIRLYRK